MLTDCDIPIGLVLSFQKPGTQTLPFRVARPMYVRALRVASGSPAAEVLASLQSLCLGGWQPHILHCEQLGVLALASAPAALGPRLFPLPPNLHGLLFPITP